MGEIIDLESLTSRIKNKMAELKITQAQLAKSADVTPAAISQIMKKDRTPSSEVLVKLAKALGVSIDYLVGKSKNAELYDLLQNSEVRDFYKEFSVLSQVDKDKVKFMIEVLKPGK